MDLRVVLDPKMGLRTDLLRSVRPDRGVLDVASGQRFLTFWKMRVRTQTEADRVGRQSVDRCAPLGCKVDVVVNCDGFRLDTRLP